MPQGIFPNGNKGQFKKGIKMPRDMAEKSARTRKGMPCSAERKEKLRKANKGQIPWNKNKRHTEEEKKKLYKTRRGKFCYQWLGGLSFEPYGLEFNEDLKEVIRNRDRRKCQICEKTELENKRKLLVHHIDYNKKNNDPKNLISLCLRCHLKTNFNRKYWIKYFDNNYGQHN